MDATTRAFVRERAKGRCEYCQLRQEHAETIHHIEHIVARQHKGNDDISNLALACIHCNSHKGPNLAGIDLEIGEAAFLFNPRRDAWADHFTLQGARIVGLTPIGRATVDVLAMNARHRLNVRDELRAQELYP